MNNEGLHVVCQSCAKRMLESLSASPVILTISNMKTFNDKCTIEDGLLGGKCGNDGRFLISVQRDERK
jgi:hypothetical protein